MKADLQGITRFPSHSFNTGHDRFLQRSLFRKMQREHVILKDDIAVPSFECGENPDDEVVWMVRQVFRFTNANFGKDPTVSPGLAVGKALEMGYKCFTERTLFQLLASYDQPLFRGATVFPLEGAVDNRLIYQVDGVGDRSIVRAGKNVPYGQCVTWAFMV